MGTTNLSDLAVDSINVGGVAQSGTLRAGKYTAVAQDDTDGDVVIATGLASITSFVVMILRANVPIASDQAITVSGGTITVADGGATYDVTAGDVFYWIAVGA